MGKRRRQIKEKLKNLPNSGFSRLKATLILVLSLLTLVLVLLGLSYSQLGSKIIPLEAALTLDSWVAQVPFLPKTPKQVLSLGLVRNRDLTSYNFSTTLQAKIPNGSMLADFSVQGSYSPSTTKTDLRSVLKEPIEGEIALKTIEKEEDFYFLIDKSPPLPGYDLSKLMGEWQKINLSKFQENLGVSAKSEAGIVQDVRGQLRKTYQDLLEESLSRVREFKTVEDRNGEFYHIVLTPQVQKLGKVLGFGEELETREASLELFVDKRAGYLNRVVLTTQLLPRETGLNEQLVELTFDYRIYEVGLTPTVESPTEYSEISGPLDLSLKIVPLESVSITQQDLRLGDTGENFLTVERLLKVLLLLPRSL